MREAGPFTKAVNNSIGGNPVNSCFPILLNELNEETEESGGHYDNPNAMPFFPLSLRYLHGFLTALLMIHTNKEGPKHRIAFIHQRLWP